MTPDFAAFAKDLLLYPHQVAAGTRAIEDVPLLPGERPDALIRQGMTETLETEGWAACPWCAVLVAPAELVEVGGERVCQRCRAVAREEAVAEHERRTDAAL